LYIKYFIKSICIIHINKKKYAKLHNVEYVLASILIHYEILWKILTHSLGNTELSKNSFFLKALSTSSCETMFNLYNTDNAVWKEIKLIEIMRFSLSLGTFKEYLKQ